MEKISLNSSTMTIEEAFKYFLFAKTAQGLTKKTIQGYRDHLHCISKYLDTAMELALLKKEDTQQMIASMRSNGLATNTIASYVRIFKVFLSWAREEGFCSLTIPKYKTEETIKEVYSDDELKILLKKPNLKKVSFSEYRSWVIINFILNSGARASTICGILIGDVDFDNGLVSYRHNKNHMLICLDVPGTNMDGSPMSSARNRNSMKIRRLRFFRVRCSLLNKPIHLTWFFGSFSVYFPLYIVLPCGREALLL